MKATKRTWMILLRSLFDLMTSEGVEFRGPEGQLVEAPGDIWALLKANGRVNVQFLDTERRKDGPTKE